MTPFVLRYLHGLWLRVGKPMMWWMLGISVVILIVFAIRMLAIWSADVWPNYWFAVWVGAVAAIAVVLYLVVQWLDQAQRERNRLSQTLYFELRNGKWEHEEFLDKLASPTQTIGEPCGNN